MDYKGKKLSVLLAMGLTSVGLALGGPIRQIHNPFSNHQVVSEDNTYVPEEVVNEILQQLEEKEIVLDGKYSKYISGITIDYDKISIDLVNGETIESAIIVPDKGYALMDDLIEEKYKNAQSIIIKDLDLKNLAVVDTIIEEEAENLDCDITEIWSKSLEMSHNYPELFIKNISVKDELKIEDVGTKELYEYDNWIKNTDFSECKHIWFSGIVINENKLEKIAKDKYLDTVILDGCGLSKGLNGKVEFKSNSARMLEYIPAVVSEKNYETPSELDFSGCPNLQILTIGSNSPLEKLEGIPNKLRVLSFGKNYMDSTSIRKSFSEKEMMAQIPYSMDDVGINVSSSSNMYIQDLSAIEGIETLEILDITTLNRMTSENLLKTVKTLPNLKKIVGLEVNNSIMYSDELVKYCDENGIEHPFTEKSKMIKEEISRITSEIITPEMTDEEKVESITRFVIDHMEYTMEALDMGNLTEDLLIKTWGENLYYSLFEGQGVCDGYEKLTHALLQEAGVNSYALTSDYHIWELVEINGQYYVLDTTRLDSYLEKNNMTIDDVKPGAMYYLNDLDYDYPDEYNNPHFLPGHLEQKNDKNLIESILSPILGGLGFIQKADLKDLGKMSESKPKKISSGLLDRFANSWRADELEAFVGKGKENQNLKEDNDRGEV